MEYVPFQFPRCLLFSRFEYAYNECTYNYANISNCENHKLKRHTVKLAQERKRLEIMLSPYDWWYNCYKAKHKNNVNRCNIWFAKINRVLATGKIKPSLERDLRLCTCFSFLSFSDFSCVFLHLPVWAKIVIMSFLFLEALRITIQYR